ncbi:hypothetical protein GQ57_07790 [Burkholderia sp. MSh2]|uniref:Cytoplasmic protein n=1 Tax=Burkholderia paludis TaxID=1506587 RepID=A0A6P2R8E5_9BURK|nr:MULTISPECIES: hypothetical protein [Burkholderia]KEZ06278.1 hypothetical protein GQ57_07790 [Burkholderia sp. MSh2]KFG97806.1 hypothetical protein GQ56_0107880 [Burkholderia paludis]CAB3768103.1 hypothetical protein LMG30113_05620 [Burkholderia paludis]VWC31027.1 hypothetical protein BPA30113_06288 [Burkholderia paludis]
MTETLAESAYRPRDVVNAPDIKAAIARRSVERGDPAEILAWLGNHFFRWVVGAFGHAQPLDSLAAYRALAGADRPAPDWLVRRFLTQPTSAAEPRPLYFIDPEHMLLLDRERVLVEFLRARAGTRHARKLQRITCAMAFDMWEREHQRMQARRDKGWAPSSGLALREVLRTPNGIVFEFDGHHAALREELAYESYRMQHCLGQFADRRRLRGGYGEQYAQAVQDGRLRLFTLRGAGNQPHVTISLSVEGDGLRIGQIKGKQNRHPVRRYADDVRRFLRALSPRGERHPDCEGMGLVFEPQAPGATVGEWTFVTDLRSPDHLLSVMSENFHLIEHFPQPPAVLQWLLLRNAPYALDRLKQIDPAVAAAARHALPAAALSGAAPDAPAAGATAFAIEGIPIDPALCAALVFPATADGSPPC